MFWKEPTDNATGCYVCVVQIAKGMSKKWTVHYSKIPSALRPVLRNDDILVSESPKSYGIDNWGDNETLQSETSSSYNQDPCLISIFEPHLIIQSDINDFVVDL